MALLELGDLSQLPKVEAALAKEDWKLDPRGFRSIWRAISPFLQAAAGILLTGGIGAMTAIQQIKKAVQLVGNFASGERSRYLAKVDARQGATAQLRWQAAEAIAAAQPEECVATAREAPRQRGPAGTHERRARPRRARRPESARRPGARLRLDFGAENGISRSPEVRAALLRAAWLRDPAPRATRDMARLAAADPDGAVRFIGLAILRPAAERPGEAEKADLFRRGGDDVAALGVAFWVGGDEEEARATGLVALGGADEHFAVFEQHAQLLADRELPGLEFVLLLVGGVTGEVAHEEDRLEVGMPHGHRRAAVFGRNVEDIARRPEVGGDSLDHPSVAIARHNAVSDHSRSPGLAGLYGSRNRCR